MLDNFNSEPFVPTETVSTVNFTKEPTPLEGHLFVKLKILSKIIDYSEIENYYQEVREYEEEYEEYTEELTDNRELGLRNKPTKPKRPELPIIEAAYAETNYNLADKIITAWRVDLDKKYNCPIIIFQYYYKNGIILGEPEQENVQISEQEWVKLLTKLGAIT